MMPDNLIHASQGCALILKDHCDFWVKEGLQAQLGVTAVPKVRDGGSLNTSDSGDDEGVGRVGSVGLRD